MNKLGYLAAPYQHSDEKVEKERLQAVTQAAARLFEKGIYVFSPLTHNVPMGECGIHGNFERWRDYDLLLLSRCDLLYILKLDGWKESKGVQAELAYAKENALPIIELEPSEILGEIPTFAQ